MEPEGTIPCSYQPVNWPCSESDKSIPYHHTFFQIRFSTMFIASDTNNRNLKDGNTEQIRQT
jgi:hypothetical protein